MASLSPSESAYIDGWIAQNAEAARESNPHGGEPLRGKWFEGWDGAADLNNDKIVQELLEEGRKNPLPREEAERVMTHIVTFMQERSREVLGRETTLIGDPAEIAKGIIEQAERDRQKS